LRTVFDLAKKKQRKNYLEKETQKIDFWKDKERAIEINQELAKVTEEIRAFKELEEDLENLSKLEDTGEQEKRIKEFEQKLKEQESQVFLAGPYDKKGAILSIFSGAGGRDAEDWVTMLLRMYERYCQRKGYKTVLLEQSFGEGGGPEGRIGTKSVTLEIQGDFAYGFLKGERGVHRLVRISPFSPKKLRHTSFALVEMLPAFTKAEEAQIQIKPENLKLETFRASGPGGQYVNRRETAVRITHIPTGIKVSCQSERSQAMNREKAMTVLAARLHHLKEREKEKELKKIKGERVSASWGNQIRSYVLHPYQLVKDLRTEVETSNVETVLDGQLDKFIEAEIKLTR